MNNSYGNKRTAFENPCFNCKNRSVKCHSNCESYFNFKQKIQLEKEKNQQQRKSEYTLFWERRNYCIKNQYNY